MSDERDELALILVNTQRGRYGLPPRETTEHCSESCWAEVDAILAAGYQKPEYEWATQYATEPQPIRAISEESARELAAMIEGVQLLKRPAAGEWTVVNNELS